MQVPKLAKIVINMGLGDCKDNAKAMEMAVNELTGETKYLEAGRTTFWSNIRDVSGAALGDKRIVEDAVIVNGGPTKSFAQSCVPLSVYYKAIADAGML